MALPPRAAAVPRGGTACFTYGNHGDGNGPTITVTPRHPLTEDALRTMLPPAPAGLPARSPAHISNEAQALQSCNQLSKGTCMVAGGRGPLAPALIRRMAMVAPNAQGAMCLGGSTRHGGTNGTRMQIRLGGCLAAANLKFQRGRNDPPQTITATLPSSGEASIPLEVPALLRTLKAACDAMHPGCVTQISDVKMNIKTGSKAGNGGQARPVETQWAATVELDTSDCKASALLAKCHLPKSPLASFATPNLSTLSGGTVKAVACAPSISIVRPPADRTEANVVHVLITDNSRYYDAGATPAQLVHEKLGQALELFCKSAAATYMAAGCDVLEAHTRAWHDPLMYATDVQKIEALQAAGASRFAFIMHSAVGARLLTALGGLHLHSADGAVDITLAVEPPMLAAPLAPPAMKTKFPLALGAERPLWDEELLAAIMALISCGERGLTNLNKLVPKAAAVGAAPVAPALPTFTLTDQLSAAYQAAGLAIQPLEQVVVSTVVEHADMVYQDAVAGAEAVLQRTTELMATIRDNMPIWRELKVLPDDLDPATPSRPSAFKRQHN